MSCIILRGSYNVKEIVSYGRILWDDGIEREVPVQVIDAIKLAYAITIHKSQGSQFEQVVIALDACQNLDRTMLYTAITRGQNKVVVVGNINTLKSSFECESAKSRNVHLGAKMRRLMNNRTKKQPKQRVRN